MKRKIKLILGKMHDSPLSPFFKTAYDRFTILHYYYLSFIWLLHGQKKPSAQEAEAVIKDVTFIYKSFERQNMAKRLYKNIQHYYPGARVIIADDSKKPLKLKGENLTVIQLPFNTGLSYGLNRALEKVETPYTMRMDDDVLLTPFSKIHEQLSFLNRHPEIHLSAVQQSNSPLLPPPQELAKEYLPYYMKNAAKPLIIPHKTKIDNTHFVMGKTPNQFLIRTKEFKELRYDDNIRMIDHHEFFMRAAGNIVSSMDISAFVFHYHNRFDKHYDLFRSDYKRDLEYIRKKHKISQNKNP